MKPDINNAFESAAPVRWTVLYRVFPALRRCGLHAYLNGRDVQIYEDNRAISTGFVVLRVRRADLRILEACRSHGLDVELAKDGTIIVERAGSGEFARYLEGVTPSTPSEEGAKREASQLLHVPL